METTNILDQINNRFFTKSELTEQKIAQLKVNLEREEAHLNIFKAILPNLQACIEKKHLEITSIGYSKTGANEDWSEENRLNFSLTLTPTSGAFKFISFKGYDARGRGKNQDALVAKATQLEEYIKQATGLTRGVSINQYSLEADKDGNEAKNRVLVNIWA